MAIESGTKVWLKTGSPAMTVKSETQNGEWLCTWFEENDVKEHAFMPAQLTEEEPD